MPKKVIEVETGKLGEVPDEQYDLAIGSKKYRPATEEDLKFFLEKKKYDNPLRAGWLRLLSSQSAGISDLIIGGIGGAAAKEGLRKYEKYNPTASLLGEIAGYVSPGGVEAIVEKGLVKAAGKTALSKGVGTLLKVPSLPARAARTGARFVGHLPGKYIPNKYGGKALSKVLGMAGEGAVEGAYFGAHQAVKESVLGDSQLNGEKLASQILKEIEYGAEFGGALGIGGQALKGVGWGLKKTGGAAKRLAYRTWGRGAEALSGVKTGTLVNDFNPSTLSGRSKIRRVQRKSDTVKSVFEQGKVSVSQIANDLQEIGYHASDARKVRALANSLPRSPGKFAPIYSNYELTVRGIEGRLFDMLEEAERRSTYPKGKIKKIISRFKGIEDRINSEIDAMSLGDLLDEGGKITGKHTRQLAKITFDGLDEMKSFLQKASSSFVESSARSGNLNSLQFKAAGYELRNIINDTVRKNLETQKIWGNAAKIQREVNSVWSQQIPAADNFKKMFLAKANDYGIGGKRQYVKDAPWFTFLNKHLGQTEHESKLVVQQYLDFATQHANNVDNLINLPARTKRAVRRLNKNVDKLKRQLKALEETHVLSEAYKGLKSGGKFRVSAPIGMGPTALFFAGEPALGMAMWGGLKVLDSLSSPVGTIEALAGAENFLNKYGKKISKGAGLFAKGSINNVRRATHAKRTETERKFDKVHKSIYSHTPRETHEKVIASMPEPVLPDTALVAADTAARVHAAQLVNMPVADVRPFMQGEPPSISKAEQFKVVERVEINSDPQGFIVENMNNGTITSEAVAYADLVFPESMNEIRDMYTDEVNEIDNAGRLLPFQKRLSLEKLFKQQAVAQSDIQYLQEMASAYSAEQQQQQQQPQSAKRGSGSMEIAQAYEQGSQRTERGTHKA